MEKMNQDELEFIVFCIENVASELGISGDKAYELLSNKSNILKEYLLPNFEILHTQSKEYIISDIIEYMQLEGVLK